MEVLILQFGTLSRDFTALYKSFWLKKIRPDLLVFCNILIICSETSAFWRKI